MNLVRSILEIILNIILFLIIFQTSTIVHEFGHALPALSKPRFIPLDQAPGSPKSKIGVI